MGKSSMHVKPAKEAGIHGVGTVRPEKGPGPHSTGKSVDAAISRRDDHPGKQKEKAKHKALIADQRIVADTLGSESFPQHSTADSKKLAARRRKD